MKLGNCGIKELKYRFINPKLFQNYLTQALRVEESQTRQWESCIRLMSRGRRLAKIEEEELLFVGSRWLSRKRNLRIFIAKESLVNISEDNLHYLLQYLWYPSLLLKLESTPWTMLQWQFSFFFFFFMFHAQRKFLMPILSSLIRLLGHLYIMKLWIKKLSMVDLIQERRPAFAILSPHQEFNLAMILSAIS